ncbi:MAG: D-amino acid dehydrogenase [Neisseriaceae bacterium]|nr:D-amino acid dehydrogenase [Neisseriaceae bacterium]
MRILIIGAGIIGLTSAWYLSQAGHDVVILDKHKGPARGASFANGGMLSVGHCAPTAAPGLPTMAVKSMFQHDAAFSFRPDWRVAQLQWMWRALWQCTAKRYDINRSRMVNLGKHSRACFHELQTQLAIPCDWQQGGVIQLCETTAQLAAAKQQQAGLLALGMASKVLHVDELLAIEPGLRYSAKPLVGALHMQEEESGDCALFAQGLLAKLQALGVTVRFGVTVHKIVQAGGRVSAVHTSEGDFDADAYVVAGGDFSPDLLKGIVNIPIYPIKGYSLTLDVVNEDSAPKHALLDMSKNVAMTRMGNRVRVAGYAELRGHDARVDGQKVSSLKTSLDDWFVDAVDLKKSSPWVGFRPMTPDGTPYISRTPLANLYLNAGQGIYGWTLSCGSAEILSRLINQQASEQELADYAINRH